MEGVHIAGSGHTVVSVSAVEDLFSKVLTELLTMPDQPPQLLMVKKYIMKMIC